VKKIPTLFVRDPENMSRVLPEYHAACGWVRDGEGVATRKYDGTCVMFDGTEWWARREVKPDKHPPAGFRLVERDAATGKRVGWEPIEQSAFAKFHAQAVANDPLPFLTGTFELVGPKINGNPERYNVHVLISHARASKLEDAPRTFDGLRRYLLDPWFVYEGIVWHHPDGRMAKLKRRDFGGAS
jgi:hypothetical protein